MKLDTNLSRGAQPGQSPLAAMASPGEPLALQMSSELSQAPLSAMSQMPEDLTLDGIASDAPQLQTQDVEGILKQARMDLIANPYDDFINRALAYLPSGAERMSLMRRQQAAAAALPTAGQGVGFNDLDENADARSWMAFSNKINSPLEVGTSQHEHLMRSFGARDAQRAAEVEKKRAEVQNAAAAEYKISSEMLGKQSDLIKDVLNAAKTGVSARAASKFQFDYIPGVGYVKADPTTGNTELLNRAWHGKELLKLVDQVNEEAKTQDFLTACNGDQVCANKRRQAWVEDRVNELVSTVGLNRPQASPQVPPKAEFDQQYGQKLLSQLRGGQRVIDPSTNKDITDELREALEQQAIVDKWKLAEPAALAKAQPPQAAPTLPLVDPVRDEQRKTEAGAVAKAAADTRSAIGTKVGNAVSNIEIVKRLEALPDPFLGPVSEWSAQTGAMLAQLGANGPLIQKATTTGEVMSVINQMVADMQVEQKGVQTEGDAQRYARAKVDLGSNTPEAYRFNIRALRAMNEYQLYQGQMMEEYARRNRDSTIGFTSDWVKQAAKQPMSAYYVNPSKERELEAAAADMLKRGVLKDKAAKDKWFNAQLQKSRQLLFRNEFIRSYVQQFPTKNLKDAEAAWADVSKRWN